MTRRTPAAVPKPPSLLHRALEHYLHDRLEAARADVELVVRREPQNGAAWQLAGAVNRKLDNLAAAERAWVKALALAPGSIEVQFNLGSLYQDQRRIPLAIKAYQDVLERQPQHVPALNNLGSCLESVGELSEAIGCYDKALALKPDYHKALHNKGIALHALGRATEAVAAVESAIALAPRDGNYLRTLSGMKTFSRDDPHLRLLEQLDGLGDQVPAPERMHLHFALGKACSDLADHAAAFAHWQHGNRLMRSRVSYDEPAALARLASFEQAFPHDALAAKPRPPTAELAPVFVVGMPRSGSSLVEQILASHPQIHGAGECDDLRRIIVARGGAFPAEPSPEQLARLPDATLEQIGTDYLAALQARSPGTAYITDKMPRNFLYLGLIHRLFADARIVHTQRDPVDTCVSCYAQLFEGDYPYIYDLGELGRYWRAYDRLMAHWRAALPAGRMLEVRYEDLVADPEAQAKRLIAHCGLPWDPRCLAFHDNKRAVRTASAAQVRQPIYRSSAGRAHRYGALVAPLVEALGLAPAPR